MNVRRLPLDWLLEALSLLALAATFWVVLASWHRIPAQAPVLFDAAGKPDGYADKTGLFLLPSTALSLYVLLTAAAVRRKLISLPANIDPDRPEVRALLARTALLLKFITVANLLYLERVAVNTALGDAAGPIPQLPLLSVLPVIATVGYFINQLRRYQN